MSLKLITAPATVPVSIAEAKSHCRVDASDEDSWFAAAIGAAVAKAEHELGRALITQTWEAVYDAFPSGGIELGRSPVQSITTLKYLDATGSEQTVSPSAYVLDAVADQGIGWLLPAAGTAWPAAAAAVNAVRVRFVCGYADTADSVPAAVRQWILMHVATAHRMRESIAAGVSVAELPNRYVDALLDSERVWRL